MLSGRAACCSCHGGPRCLLRVVGRGSVSRALGGAAARTHQDGNREGAEMNTWSNTAVLRTTGRHKVMMGTSKTDTDRHHTKRREPTSVRVI